MTKKNCTIDRAVAALAGHRLVSAQPGVILCSCGSWLTTPDNFSDHQGEAIRADLSAVKPREPITTEKLEEVAAAYAAAPPRRRGAAAGAVLGCSAASASYYVFLARKEGLLPPASHGETGSDEH
jgi:hypothetical protein